MPDDSDQLMFYRESEDRPDPAGRHQRSRRHVRLDRSGDVVLDARRDHDPVLHLLLDVRLPAHRRPGLGGGRHAFARLPARRHGGPHDAERRRPAARRRPLAAVGGIDPELRELRPDLRLRSRGDHAGRPAPHGGGAGRRVLLHHGDERELRAPGDSAGRVGSDGHHQGHVLVQEGRSRQEGAARATDGRGHDLQRSRSPPPNC